MRRLLLIIPGAVALAAPPSPTPSEVIALYPKQYLKLLDKPRDLGSRFSLLCGAPQKDIQIQLDSLGLHQMHTVNYLWNGTREQWDTAVKTNAWPVGSVIVKEKLHIGYAKPNGIAGMIRRDTGWEFFFQTPERKDQPAAFLAAKDLTSCAHCHRDAPHDGVFARAEAPAFHVK